MKTDKKRKNRPGKYLPENVQKKSGHPTQPGNRSTASISTNRKRNSGSILYQIAKKFKCSPLDVFATLVCLVVAVFALVCVGCVHADDMTEPVATLEPTIQTEAPTEATEPTEPVPEYIFRDGDGYPVDMQSLTSAWAAEAGMEKRYDLTDAERWEVASVVTAEAGGEPFAGMVAVAQCILQACEDDGIRPTEAVVEYDYTGRRPDPTEEALEAVQAVFDFGHVVTSEPILYFYNPNTCRSNWHESQVYVLTINNHRFFKEAE